MVPHIITAAKIDRGEHTFLHLFSSRFYLFPFSLVVSHLLKVPVSRVLVCVGEEEKSWYSQPGFCWSGQQDRVRLWIWMLQENCGHLLVSRGGREHQEPSVKDHSSRVREEETLVLIVGSVWAQVRVSGGLECEKLIFCLIISFKEVKTGVFTTFNKSFPASWLNNHSRAILVD